MRHFLFLSLCSLLFLQAQCDRSTEQETIPEKPNILFLFADDQAFNTINSLGNDEVHTPNLDKLVKQGVSFVNAYNMGAWNGAVCIASRSMIITGLSVHRANKAQTQFDDRAAAGQMWGKLMNSAGYDTYFAGKWHTKSSAVKNFDNVGTVRPGMPRQTPEGYNRPKSKDDKEWTPWDTSFGGFWQGGRHWSAVTADETIAFLDQAKDNDNPFFMYTAFNAPHDPRQAPKEVVEMYDVNDIDIPANFVPSYPYKQEIGCYMIQKKNKTVPQRDENLAPHPRTEYAVKVHRQEYYASITYLDQQIGRIFDALEKSGKLENTYVIFSADHGLACGNHGLLGKQNMYEHSMKPPLIIAGAGIPKNKQQEGLVYLQDIMATTLELAGVEKPDYVEYKSLLPLCQTTDRVDNYESVYGSFLSLQRMVRKGDYKLIVYPAASKVYLFDLAKDPLEMNDLSEDPAFKAKKVELFKELQGLQEQYEDAVKLDPALVGA